MAKITEKNILTTKTMNTKTTLISIAGFVCIFLAIGANNILSATQQETQPPQAEPQYPIVSVTDVSPRSKQAEITAYGEVTSRNQLSITSQVSGQIIYISPNFLTGKTFNKGEVLLEIEPIAYQQSLANALATLADAKLALAEEQLNNEQAKQEWLQSGLATEQASELVLRHPQLAVAKANVTLATNSVAKAKYDLAQTKLVAPFDALVVSKDVQVGTNIQVGTALAQLYDISLFEISLPLSYQQWQLLPKNSPESLKDMHVQLTDETNGTTWLAKVDRYEQHINSQNRQRALVVTVERPIELTQPLFPGTFVKATITGNAIEQLWQLPASALIDNNTVWQVNDEGLLMQLPVNLVFSMNDAVYVQPLNHLSQAKIVNRPLASYLKNMKVDAKIEEVL